MLKIKSENVFKINVLLYKTYTFQQHFVQFQQRDICLSRTVLLSAAPKQTKNSHKLLLHEINFIKSQLSKILVFRSDSEQPAGMDR